MSAGANRIPLAGTTELRPDVRRSRAVRVGLATVLLVALVATLSAARRADDSAPALLLAGADGVIVLDVSGSVGPREYRQLARGLEEAIASKRRYGLVAFSDVAYEVFPPGTDPAQVRAVRRFFVPTKQRRDRLGIVRHGRLAYRASIWTASLTGGTRISRGLLLAREIIKRDRLRKRAVVLISDLAYEPNDIGPLEETLTAYAREGIPLRVVGLASERSNQLFFERFRQLPGAEGAEPAMSFVAAGSPAARQSREPLTLAALALVVLALLAVNELVCGRLTWSTARPAGRSA